MAKLILVRHGKSEWNKLGKWTGWTDVGLVEEGLEEARRAARSLTSVQIDHVHVSTLKRAHETFEEMRGILGLGSIKPKVHEALKERSYGIYTGKNKWQVKEEVGEEEFKKIRRSWSHPIPKGETMKDVYDRVVPYYNVHMLPALKRGENVLSIGHGNTFRALMKYLEGLSDEGVSELEFGTGEVYIYDVDEMGNIVGKEIRAANRDKLKV
ncbi:2,3-bisphosphoglycerate-dependent phosphoglycerate mutase [Candidatus Kaiserbacteria bacterium]|nr:2,3-bisphosphoglycerate-dependent phosphoglycerate mutase [Candidatus Kaiserbacteria bacterium]